MSEEQLTQPIDTEAEIQPAGTVEEKLPWGERYLHIDDFLDSAYEIVSRPGLAYAHFLFSHWRKPAVDKSMHEPFMRKFKLFVDYEGKTWRVTGASRMGDIWLQSDFTRDHGYTNRVDLVLTRFTNWRAEADRPLTWAERVQIGIQFYGLPEVVRPGYMPAKCNRIGAFLSRAGAPIRYLDTTPEQREFIAELERLTKKQKDD